MLSRLNIASRQFSVSAAACKPETVKNWINGRAVESKTSDWIELTNPATNEVIGLVPKTTQQEMQEAVDSSSEAFHKWKNSSILSRQQVFFKLQSLIKRDMRKLAENITLEQGKTIPDAEGDVSRGLQVNTNIFWNLFINILI
jgi:malonate-semialdehyde dehydrogenase (acetylating)/methylmalonate-semialdehyde dehydrogenase